MKKNITVTIVDNVTPAHPQSFRYSSEAIVDGRGHCYIFHKKGHQRDGNVCVVGYGALIFFDESTTFTFMRTSFDSEFSGGFFEYVTAEIKVTRLSTC